MTTPLYNAGDRVMVRAMASNSNVRPGIYKVIRTLPHDSEGHHYRVKSEHDAHERVFQEADLDKA